MTSLRRDDKPVLDLSDRELAGQLVVFGFPKPEPTSELLTALSNKQCAGVVLFRRNLDGLDLSQVRELCAEIQGAAVGAYPALIAIDEEGGRVRRLPAPALRVPAMARVAAHGGAPWVERIANAVGQELSALGINLNFAPVVDVNSNPDNPVIGDRAFGPDPVAVIECAIAYCEGLASTGVANCLKHFPGHGDTALDSHLSLPRVTHGWPRLRDVELFPFSELVEWADSVMTAHVVFDAIEPGVPATLSARAIEGVLRGEMAYDGVVFSDDLDMHALDEQGELAEVAVRAMDAGCDVLLACGDRHDPSEVREALCRAMRDRPYFRDRCERAAERSLSLRRRVCRPPPPREHHERLQAEVIEPLQSELEFFFHEKG